MHLHLIFHIPAILQGFFQSSINYLKLRKKNLVKMCIYKKQDSKELSPRPLENALKTFNPKKNSFQAFFDAQRLIKLLMLIMLPKLSRLVANL